MNTEIWSWYYSVKKRKPQLVEPLTQLLNQKEVVAPIEVKRQLRDELLYAMKEFKKLGRIEYTIILSFYIAQLYFQMTEQDALITLKSIRKIDYSIFELLLSTLPYSTRQKMLIIEKGLVLWDSFVLAAKVSAAIIGLFLLLDMII